MPKNLMKQRLEYLAKELDLTELDVVNKALEAGVQVLYREHMANKFLEGQITRQEALEILGPREVARLECQMGLACEDSRDLLCGHA